MLDFIQAIILLIFFISIYGYCLVILKEKLYMKKNIIVIDNKHLTKDDLKDVDVNEFILKGKRVKSGDEVKVTTLSKEKLNGTLIGGNIKNRAIHIITFDNEVKKLVIDDISKFKIISKYGKFLNY